MTEKIPPVLSKIKTILDNIVFLGHPPPKPINWEETREQILLAFEEQEYLIQQAKEEVAREITKQLREWANEGKAIIPETRLIFIESKYPKG